MNYAERDIVALDEEGGFYARHVQAMTEERLHDKGDIAAELGWRDAQIARLKMLRGLDEDRYQALIDRCNELEAVAAAMLQRWAVIHNLEVSRPAGSERDEAVAAVAALSAAECVADGGRAGGARLLRQERAARVLLQVAEELKRFPVRPQSRLHDEIRVAAQQLSSYPQLYPVVVGKAGDLAPEALRPGEIQQVEKS